MLKPAHAYTPADLHSSLMQGCIDQIIRMYGELEVSIRRRSRDFGDLDDSTNEEDLSYSISRAVQNIQNARDRYACEFGAIPDVDDSTAIIMLLPTMSKLRGLLDELRPRHEAFDDRVNPDFLQGGLSILAAGGESSTKALEDLRQRSEYRVAIAFVYVLSPTPKLHDALDPVPSKSQLEQWLTLIASTITDDNKTTPAASGLRSVAQFWSNLCKHYR